jgi:hypothetical protein
MKCKIVKVISRKSNSSQMTTDSVAKPQKSKMVKGTPAKYLKRPKVPI